MNVLWDVFLERPGSYRSRDQLSLRMIIVYQFLTLETQRAVKKIPNHTLKTQNTKHAVK